MKKLNKTLSVILAILMVLSIIPITASAVDTEGICGENLTWVFDDSTGTLTISGTGDMEDYSSSSTLPWNEFTSQIVKVVIENGVTSVGNYTFYDLDYLTEAVLGDSITTIGERAFQYSRKLKTVKFPANLTTIETSAFSSTDVSDIEFGDKLTTIGFHAFSYCYGLETLELPDSLETIDNYAFYSSGLKHIVIPDSVTKLSTGIFLECASLESVKLPKNSTTFPSFEGCSKLKSIEIPEGVTSVPYYAFQNCTSLESVSFPSTLTALSYYMFTGCTSLKEFVVPENVTEIPYHAFDSSGLEKITFHNKVTSIDSYAFYNCVNLKSIDLPNSLKSIDMYAFTKSAIESIVIPDSVTTITQLAFASCYNLKSVKLSNSLTTIEKYLFQSTALESITIPDSVTTIGDYAFQSCKNLKSVNFSNNLTSIGNYAFRNTAIEQITIPATVTSIGTLAFYSETLKEVTFANGTTIIGGSRIFSTSPNLKKITIPNTVGLINEDAFDGCSALENVYYGGTVKDWATKITFTNEKSNPMYYANNIYFNNELLTELELPSSITKINNYAFYNFDSISNLKLPEGCKQLGEYAFAECSNITQVTLSDSLEEIPDYAFQNCKKLEKVIIPASVSSISMDAFVGCTSLSNVVVDNNNETYSNDEYGVLFNKDKTMLIQYPAGGTQTSYTIPDGVTTIGVNAFNFATNLESVTIPASVTTLGKDALKGNDYNLVLYYNGTEEQWKQLLSNNSSTSKYLEMYTVHCTDNASYPSGTLGDGNVTWEFNNVTGTLTISGEGGIPSYSSLSSLSNRPWNSYMDGYVKHIVIGDGITYIGKCAFAYSESLRTVTIGKGVKYIVEDAFYDSDCIIFVYYNGTKAEWNNIEIETYNSELTDAKIYTTDYDYTLNSDSGTFGDNATWDFDAQSKTLTISGSGELSSVFDYDDESLSGLLGGKYSFRFNGNSPWDIYKYDIEKVVINDGITFIGYSNFRFFVNLKEVIIPASVTTIDACAFRTDENLTDVYYMGTEEQWNKILIYGQNDPLLNATKHYNYSACEHNYEVVETVAPTCISIGYTKYVCSICNGSYTDNYTDYVAHEYTSVVVAPTCTDNGYTKHTCAICGDYYTDNNVKATGHNYQASATVSPTCTASGYIKYTCANGCGTTKKEITESALGHDYSPAVTFEPTCTAKGYTKQTCARCRNVNKYDYVAALGHDYVLTSTTAPTCTAQGCAIYQCSLCDDTKTEYYADAKGHNYEWTIIVEPTCTVDGTQSGICLECGAETTGGVSRLGHDWYDEYEVDYAPTCTKDGQESRHCSRCNWRLDARPIPAGHPYGEWEQVGDAKCGEYGKFERYCSLCGQIEVMNAPADHDYSIEKNVVEATCTTAGSKTLECSCGATKTEIIPATGHSYEQTVTAPTCTEKGYTTYTCTCGETYIDDYVDALGHTPATAVEENYVAPNCTEKGSIDIVVYCSVCDEEISRETEEIDANGHSYKTVITSPTCTEQGYTTYTCACGDTYVDDEVSALGHTDGNVVEENYVAPTCTENGSKDNVTYCTVCNVETNRETVVVSATGHNYVNGTCTNCGDNDVYYYNGTFHIQSPSTTSIRHKDGIKLHAKVEGTVPAGSYVKWTASNGKFKTEEINDGNSLKIISDSNGKTTFTATLYSADGEILATDTIEMNSKAGFFDKIGSFFRSIFGGTKIYEN